MTTGTLITVAKRRNPRLVRLLRTVPALGYEHNWEGAFEGARGAAAGCTLRVKAQIAFHGDLIEGAGRFVDFRSGGAAGDDGFALTGTATPGAVSLELWFSAAEARRVPLAATGIIGCNGREMSGDWAVACFNPDTCGCDGGGGTFHLKRID